MILTYSGFKIQLDETMTQSFNAFGAETKIFWENGISIVEGDA